MEVANEIAIIITKQVAIDKLPSLEKLSHPDLNILLIEVSIIIKQIFPFLRL